MVYTCTEDIEHNGQIFAYQVGSNGELFKLGAPVDAGGTSTCYLTIDKAAKHMLAVNYWDSTLAVIPLDPETGAFAGPVQHMYDPKQGQRVVATGRCQGGVNHSNNDDSTIRMRQADPHSHALVLDPFVGTVAYVPDLGKDLIREFFYDKKLGKIDLELNVLPSGLCTGHPDGPRYFEFHPTYNVAYVVNELSCTVTLMNWDKNTGKLDTVQSISTLPADFKGNNNCSDLHITPNGQFLYAANRGHNSIVGYSIDPTTGALSLIGHASTQGEVPRNFAISPDGRFLYAANQNSDNIVILSIGKDGKLKYRKEEKVFTPVCVQFQ